MAAGRVRLSSLWAARCMAASAWAIAAVIWAALRPGVPGPQADQRGRAPVAGAGPSRAQGADAGGVEDLLAAHETCWLARRRRS